ncbi:MAG TPA: ISKra4 family transposase [Chloroflexota bacterium]|nr:ISKra4 family transposase [Chloroflexota bacterium]
MVTARPVSKVFSPLDSELALLPGQLTPLLQDHLAHLGTWMPFAQAAAMLACFTHVSVSASTAQRHTEALGIAYEAVQRAEVEYIEQAWPDVPPGPETVVLSVDGAMVPLVGGEWAEVKTLVVGEGREPASLGVAPANATHHLSYFSRLTDAETFQRLTLGELYRRQVETAGQVVAVSDGAEWIQGFVDYHCPAAIRILDFPHAAERISQIGENVLGEGSAASAAWRMTKLHQLKHEGAADLLSELQGFARDHRSRPVIAENVAYLAKRVAQMQYPFFQAQGWPIGSGIVESANKLVVEARLKGAGMHWARTSINAMLALRNAVCNDRWAEAWAASAAYLRTHRGCQRPVQSKHQPAPAPPTPPAPPPAPRDPAARRKPAANHPWRRYPTRDHPSHQQQTVLDARL